MRILYLASDWGLTLDQDGGAGAHMRGTIGGFTKCGCEVLPVIGGDLINTSPHTYTRADDTELAAPGGVMALFKIFFPAKIRLLIREIRYYVRYRKLVKKAIAAVRAFAPEVIYERSGYYSFAGNKLSGMLKIPLFLETDGCMVEVIKSKYGVFSLRLGNSIERMKLRKADYVVVYNNYSIPFIRQKFSLPTKAMVAKPLGVDLPDGLSALSRQALDIKDDAMIVGFVGSFAPYQGIPYLIEAARILSAKGVKQVAFILVGWGKNAKALKDRSMQLGLDNVLFVGEVEKHRVNDYISLFDIAVVPDAERLVYPIKTLEYGLFGACPLVPDYDVFSEVIEDGVNGYCFKRGDAQSLSDRIEWLHKNVSARRIAGLNWKKTVTQSFLWEKTVSQTVNAMGKAIENNLISI